MGLLGLIKPSWEEIDYGQLHVKVKIIAGSFFFFVFVSVLCHGLSSLLKTYNGLRLKEKMLWSISIARAIFGVFITVVGIWTMWWDQELKKDVVFATTPTSFVSIFTTIGFCLFECCTVLLFDITSRKVNVLVSVHHWLVLAYYLSSLRSTHYFAINGLLVEVIIPFFSLSYLLSKCGLADTWLWWLNQCLLVHACHLRSVVETWLWLETYRHWDHIWADMPAVTFVAFYTGLTAESFIMTPYWTYRNAARLFVPTTNRNFQDAEKTKTTNGAAKKEQ